MVASDSSLRVVGVSLVDVTDWADPLPAGKWSQFFRALAQRVTLVETIRPVLPRREEYLDFARSFYPGRARWLAKAGFNLNQTAKLTALVEQELLRHKGSYDLVVQLQTLCAPGSNNASTPFVVYTDNTFALTQRIYRAWAPLSASRARRWLAFEAGVCQSATTVFTFSEFARRSVVEDYGCAPSRVVAIGAGANQLITTLGEKDYAQPRALFVGRPFELKGGATLLKAWSVVRGRVPNAELIIAGPRDGPPRRLGPGVTWLGHVDRAQLDRLYKAATVFVLPSMFDAWGHVFVEAMGYGLPCIGTTCCAMPEIIDDGVTGRLVPRGEAEPLADALIELLTDSNKAETMGRMAHAIVLERLTWAHVTDRLVRHLPSRSALQTPQRLITRV
jgi:glycosyltransferase involved in cell wall biosynthesis